jgi:hypothetical protein
MYSEQQSPTSAPYSVEILAGYAREKCPEWEVRLHVLDSRDSDAKVRDLVADMADWGVEVIGLSMMQGTHTLGMALLDRFDERFPGPHRPQVVLGNTLPTHRPEAYLARDPSLVVVRGFGELPLVALLKARGDWIASGRPEGGADLDAIPGLALWRNGGVVINPILWPRDYAVPTWVDPVKYFARVETSRGCHFDHCTFCTRPPRQASEPKWIRFPIDPIVETIRRLKDRGITRFTFCDEDFIGADPSFCFELADRLEAIGGAPSFSFSTRADNIVKLKDPPEKNAERVALLRRLREVGLSLLFVGCESFSDKQLKRFAKANTAEGNIEAMKILERIGIPAETGFIMFDPFATIEDLLQNIDNLERHGLWRAASQTLSRMDIQEGSRLQKWVTREGLIGDYDMDQMTFDYRFKDPLVGWIADLCQKWKGETDYVYRLARNAQRMALFDDFPNHVMEEAKRLHFDFVKDVTRVAARDPKAVPEVIEAMKARRRGVISRLSETITAPSVHLETAERLRQEISGFLGTLDPGALGAIPLEQAE